MKPVKYRTAKELAELTKQNQKSNSAAIQRWKKKKPAELDHYFLSLHNEAFSKFNCLHCANCCSSISPIILAKDIERLAKYFNTKPSDFIAKYLHIDEDNDYVFNQAPCPFLGSDNYCSVYECRPKACCEYPHTDRRKMNQILDLTLKNCEVCPVVYRIVDELKRIPDLQ